MKRNKERTTKIKLASLTAVIVLAGAFYFAQSVFAQPPPPPPPPPPSITPGAGGLPTSAYICPVGSATIYCCNVTASRTDAQASSQCATLCGAACTGIASGGCGTENCPNPSCNLGTCQTVADCPNTTEYVCTSGCCNLTITGTASAYQCQGPGGIAGSCHIAQTLQAAQQACISSGCPSLNCIQCPSAQCTDGINCLDSAVTKPGFQFPTQPGTRYGEGKCLPSQCPRQTGPGSGSIDLTALKPGNFSDFLSLLSCVFSYLLYFAIPIAVLVYVLAGVVFLTSRGEPDKITTAKKIVLWNTVGFTVVLLAKGILSTILLFLGSSALQISCKFFS